MKTYLEASPKEEKCQRWCHFWNTLMRNEISCGQVLSSVNFCFECFFSWRFNLLQRNPDFAKSSQNNLTQSNSSQKKNRIKVYGGRSSLYIGLIEAAKWTEAKAKLKLHCLKSVQWPFFTDDFDNVDLKSSGDCIKKKTKVAKDTKMGRKFVDKNWTDSNFTPIWTCVNRVILLLWRTVSCEIVRFSFLISKDSTKFMRFKARH